MRVVVPTGIPQSSALQAWMADDDFRDAYRAPLDAATLTPTEIFLRAVRATPPWVARLMAIRNAIVRRIGLKDVGGMAGAADKSADAYRVGDRLGIFTVFAKGDDELLLGIDDSHLDVRVSVMKRRDPVSAGYVVSTAVKVHNLLGRIYMAPVGRIHPFVVRAMMRRANV